ncbi:MAG: MBL fold metallo-hydrolase [Robiginitalea sp.]|jgi:L-ascorbate metabolism protein UlaG (beta-lactamase superfamily)
MIRLSTLFLAFSLLLMSCRGKTEKEPVSETAEADTETTAQTEDAEIFPVSHATAVLRWGPTTIYIDPVGGADTFAQFPPADLILITDEHGDHYNPETLEALADQKARVIAPRAVANKIPEGLTPRVDILDNAAEMQRYGITITAIPMYNLREEAKNFHVRGRGNGYVLEKNGQRIYFSGDTEDIPEMRALKDIDKAFVCMNLPYTMTVEQAADAVLEFAPAEVYPYHYRGRPDVSDVTRFAELVNAGNAAIKVVQLDWYPGEAY